MSSLRRSIGAENVNLPLSWGYNMFMVMMFCTTVTVCWGSTQRDSGSRWLKKSYQTQTIVPVTRTVAMTKMPIFTNAESADMHFVMFLRWKFYCCIGKTSVSISRLQTTLPCCKHVWAMKAAMCMMKGTCWIPYMKPISQHLSDFFCNRTFSEYSTLHILSM